MESDRIYHLVKKFLEVELTEAEQKEFHEILNTDSLNATVLQAFDSLTQDIYASDEYDEKLQHLLVTATEVDRPLVKSNAGKKIRLWQREWLKYAAIVLLIAGTVIYFYRAPGPETIARTANTDTVALDVAPGGNKAMLTLADGSVIVLDSAANGSLSRQGNVQIVKAANGELSYIGEPSTGSAAELVYNTLTTPKGGQYQLNLPDGTKVWLNAASSITYPATFNDEERIVSITGEVYFEVAPVKPKRTRTSFRVNINKETSIEVLGTEFNVNAYSDRKGIATTLLGGAVRISYENDNKAAKSIQLKAGQQVLINKDAPSPFRLEERPDIEKAMAWKNGLFNFEDVALEEAMRELARWYDLEIVYEKTIPSIEFGGKMSRNVSLVGLLKGLERAGLQFRLEKGRRLVILP